MAAGEFQLKQETLVATIEAYEQLAKDLATYKEEQFLILDSVQNWDSETSQTFRDSYAQMLANRYTQLEEKCVKITEILQKALEETNRLLNRRDAFPETLSPSLVLQNSRLLAYTHLFVNWGYSSVRTTGGILKLDESLRSDVEADCDEMLEIIEKEQLEVEKLRETLSGLGLSDWNLDEELNELEVRIVSQKSIENFKESFVVYCDGVKELDAYLTEELAKVTEEYGESLDAAGYKGVRLKGLEMYVQIEICGKFGEPINGWLQLYTMMTVAEVGRIVTIPSDANTSKWAMREGLDTINPYALKEIEGTNEVFVGEQGELTDKNGRYWVAVGPCVMNPNHKMSEKCSASEMKYGTCIDVIVKNDKGEQFVIPCIVGDCKAHTYPNGIYQTGDAFPNGEDSHPQNNDGSIIEFCGKASVKGFQQFSIVEIIVYDLED